jgi:hypothetical protein
MREVWRLRQPQRFDFGLVQLFDAQPHVGVQPLLELYLDLG